MNPFAQPMPWQCNCRTKVSEHVTIRKSQPGNVARCPVCGSARPDAANPRP